MTFLNDIFDVFYPDLCLCCEEYLVKNEALICVNCRHELPLTNFSTDRENIAVQSFYGRIPVEFATALFYFTKKGKIQQLIHQLKYRNQQQIGRFAGDWISSQLVDNQLFKKPDYIIPVPLHKKRLKKRGYNQVTTFGKSLSINLHIPFCENILYRTSAAKTQTNKLRIERWKNVASLFCVKNIQLLENKHILLIDDVITTGATLEACYSAMKNAKNLKISIACIAYTK